MEGGRGGREGGREGREGEREGGWMEGGDGGRGRDDCYRYVQEQRMAVLRTVFPRRTPCEKTQIIQ